MKEMGEQELKELKKKIEDKRNEVNKLLEEFYEKNKQSEQSQNVFNFQEYVKRKEKWTVRFKRKYAELVEKVKTNLYNWLYNSLHKSRIKIDRFLSDLSLKLFMMRHKNNLKKMNRLVEFMDQRDKAYSSRISSLVTPQAERDQNEKWNHGLFDGVVYNEK